MHKLSRWFDTLPLLAALALTLPAPVLGQSRPDVVWQRPGFGNGPVSAAYSPDGSMLAVSGSRAVKLWRTSDGAFLRSLRADDWMATAVWSASGATIVGLGQSGYLMRWRVSDGMLLQTIRAQTLNWGPRTAALSPDGASVATCGESDASVCIWRVSDFALERKFTLASVASVAWSSGGLIACGRTDNSIVLLGAATGSVTRTLSGHTAAVKAVSFSPDGARLVSASADKTARIWDVASGTELHSLVASTSAVYDAVFSPDGTKVATGGADRTLKVWDASAGTMSAGVSTNAWISPVAFSSDGQTICSGWQWALVAEFAAGDCRVQRQLTEQCRGVGATAVSHNGLIVASASGDNAVHLWGAADGAKGQVMSTPFGQFPAGLAFSADDTEIVNIDYYGGITRWSVADGSQTGWVAGEFYPQSAALSPGAGMAAVGSWDGQVALYNTITGDKIWGVTPAGAEAVYGLQYSPDGVAIAFWNSGGSCVLSAATGDVVASTSTAGPLVFSPDSSTLAIGTSFGVTLWTIADGTTRDVQVPGGYATPLAFTPDGTHLAVSAGNFMVEIVRLAAGATRALYTDECGLGAYSGSYSPDGKVLFYGTSDGSVVAISAPDTSADTEVTVDSWTVPVGEPVTLRATLTSGGASVSGQWVHFWFAGPWTPRWYAGSALTDTSGVASLTVIAPEPPYWQITAAFAGGGGYGYSTGTGNLWVNKVATRTYVTDRTGAIDNIVILRGYLFAPGLRNLRGKSLEFSIAGTAVGSDITNLAGRASLSYVLPAALGSGARTIGVSFAGDASYGPSSGTATLTVSKAPVYIWVLSRSAARGSRTTLRSYVRSLPLYPWLPGLAIEFALDGTSVGSSNTDASGRASVLYTVPAGLAIGDHALECAFAGNGSYLSASGSGVLTVTP